MAGQLDITIEQGANYRLSMTYKNDDGSPVNLSQYIARMQVRRRHSSPEVLLELTTENGGIALGGAAGTIILDALAIFTETMPPKLCWYDLEIVNQVGFVTRLLEGTAFVTPEVTR